MADWRVLAFQNFDCQAVDVLCVEGVFFLAHFVHDAAEAPDVGFEGVGLVIEQLRGHVVRSA